MKRTLPRSFANACRGLIFTFKTERNFRIHVIGLCFAVALGFILGLSAVDWCLVAFAIGFVLVSELFNTALERWCDNAAGGQQNDFIRHAKDVSSAAVLISAIIALVIGVLILIVPLIQRIVDGL